MSNLDNYRITHICENSVDCNTELQRIKSHANVYKRNLQVFQIRARKQIIEQLHIIEEYRRRERSQRIISQRKRIGEYTVEQIDGKLKEVWHDGTDLRNAKMNLDDIRRKIREIDHVHSNSMDTIRQDVKDCHRYQLACLRNTESQYENELHALLREKVSYLIEHKRQKDENQCTYGFEIIKANQRWPMLGKKYQLLAYMGRGTQGEVYKAFDVHNLEMVALKLYKLDTEVASTQQTYRLNAIKNEIHVHQNMKHYNVVRCIGSFSDENHGILSVMELCEGDTLANYLRVNCYLVEDESILIWKQILCGLKYMHQLDTAIIHHDLKPANILKHDYEFKITDFGTCKIVPCGIEFVESKPLRGTLQYMPPEVFENTPKISTKLDMWSMGVILYQMLYGCLPFGEGLTQDEFLRQQKLLHAKNPEFFPQRGISSSIVYLIQCCLETDVNKRWSSNMAYDFIESNIMKSEGAESDADTEGETTDITENT